MISAGTAHNKLTNLQRIRIATSVYFFVSGFGYATWASRIPTIQQQLGLSEGQLGTVLFALPVGLMFTMPFTAWLLRKFTSRWIMLLGALFFSIVLSLPGITRDIWQLGAVMFCFGCSRNLMNLSINSHSVEVQQRFDKSIMSTFHAIWSLAGFAGAGLGYLMVYWSVPVTYHFFSVSLLLASLALFYYPHSLHNPPTAQPNKKFFTLPDKSVLKLAVICFACMACENTMYDWSAIYFKKIVQSPKATATGAFALYMIAMTTGRFFGDRLVNKFGIKRMLLYSGLFIFAGLTLAVCLPYIITAGIGYLLTGLGIACIVPFIFQMAGRSKHLSSSAAIASVSTIGYLGFLIIPPTVGFIAELTSLRVSFAVVALLGALIALLTMRLKEE